MSSKLPRGHIGRWCVVLFATLCTLLSPSAGAEDTYRIGAGDLISIMVYGEPDLSLNQVRVSTNGSVPMPLLGEVSIGGLSAADAEKKITALLLDGYLNKPKVTVAVLEYRMFYIAGQVKKPGGYNYVEGLTVRKAVALAGGLTARGSEKKMTLQVEGSGDAKAVDMESAVGPGDIVTVGETFF